MSVQASGGALSAVEGANNERKLRNEMEKKNSDWTDLPEGHVLSKFSAQLAQILEKTGYKEMYGVELVAPSESNPTPPHSTLLILQKFLRANENDVPKASAQLTEALKWRKDFQPLKVKEEVFSKEKFAGLGYITVLEGVPGSSTATGKGDVATWNIYGAVKDIKGTFGNLDEFIRWRVALMEHTLSQLDLAHAKLPIPYFGKGPDPYQSYQIHDYLNISFLRQPAEVRAASQKTIQLFQAVYPETVSRKFFVNVPLFMQWMFGIMTVFMAKETVAKMQWMSYGSELHKSLGSSVPKVYGGTGPDLKDSGLAPKTGDATTTTAATKTSFAATATSAAPAAEPVAEPVTTTSTADVH